MQASTGGGGLVMRVVATLLLVGATLVGSAGARPGPDRPPGDPAGLLDSAPAAVSAAEQARVERYWTDRRMRRSVRRDTAGTPVAAAVGALIGGRLGAGWPGVAAPLHALHRARPAPVSRAAPWPAGGPVSRAVGRVFFTLHGQDYSCSGTALASRNRSTVVTAGHCVNAGPGAYARNWVFVPGYRDGRRPYGTWTARRLAAPKGWVRTGRAPDDVGFAVLNRRGGRELTRVVGGLRVGFGQPPGRYVWAFGYPGAAPFGGRRLTYCHGSTRPDPYATTARGLACTMTAGASGGPWLTASSAAEISSPTGGGTVYTVTSFAYQGLPGLIWGPALDRTAATLFAAAERW